MRIAFAALIIGALISGCSDSGSSAGGTPAKEQAAPKPVVKVTAKDLFQQYEENEVATDERIKGAVVEVSGVVQSIDKDFMDAIIIAVKTPNQFMPARLQVQDADKAKAIALKKGAKVVALCQKMSRVVGAPSGRDCTIQ